MSTLVIVLHLAYHQSKLKDRGACIRANTCFFKEELTWLDSKKILPSKTIRETNEIISPIQACGRNDLIYNGQFVDS